MILQPCLPDQSREDRDRKVVPGETTTVAQVSFLRDLARDFAIQDFFDREKMFGKPEEMMAFLKANGISEVHYEGRLDEKNWIPNYCISPIVIKDIGGFWGVK